MVLFIISCFSYLESLSINHIYFRAHYNDTLSLFNKFIINLYYRVYLTILPIIFKKIQNHEKEKLSHTSVAILRVKSNKNSIKRSKRLFIYELGLHYSSSVVCNAYIVKVVILTFYMRANDLLS